MNSALFAVLEGVVVAALSAYACFSYESGSYVTASALIVFVGVLHALTVRQFQRMFDKACEAIAMIKHPADRI